MLFVCRTEVENHVLFIIENIWRLVIMARRIGMDIKILMAKMLFMILICMQRYLRINTKVY